MCAQDKANGVSVVLEDITKTFKEDSGESVTAVDNFSFVFPSGKLTTLLGPSGCGKTTTLRCIGGFYEPDVGNIIIDDKRANGLAPHSRPTGTVFQNYALFPHMTVFGNVAYGLKIKKLSKKEIESQVANTLKLLELDGMQARYPNQLSGGQQQRVAIARVLAVEPQVLLFDEPLSNLDAKLRVYMRDEIRSLQQRTGITAIYVTHDQEEAMSISDTLIVMSDGKIMQSGHPFGIYREPQNKFVAQFIGLINLLGAKVKTASEDFLNIEIGDSTFGLPNRNQYKAGDKVYMVVRPEAISIANSDEKASLYGTIISSSFLGSLARYQVKLDTDEELTVDIHNPKIIREEHSRVAVNIDTEVIHLQKR